MDPLHSLFKESILTRELIVNGRDETQCPLASKHTCICVEAHMGTLTNIYTYSNPREDHTLFYSINIKLRGYCIKGKPINIYLEFIGPIKKKKITVKDGPGDSIPKSCFLPPYLCFGMHSLQINKCIKMF